MYVSEMGDPRVDKMSLFFANRRNIEMLSDLGSGELGIGGKIRIKGGSEVIYEK